MLKFLKQKVKKESFISFVFLDRPPQSQGSRTIYLLHIHTSMQHHPRTGPASTHSCSLNAPCPHHQRIQEMWPPSQPFCYTHFSLSDVPALSFFKRQTEGGYFFPFPFFHRKAMGSWSSEQNTSVWSKNILDFEEYKIFEQLNSLKDKPSSVLSRNAVSTFFS